MYCWYCKRPIIVKQVVKNIITDTTKVNDNVRMTEQPVQCSICGAKYTIEAYLDAKPTVSNEMLARLDNTPHP